MAGGREESRIVKQRPGVIVLLSRGIRTRWTGGRVEGRTLEFRNFLVRLMAYARLWMTLSRFLAMSKYRLKLSPNMDIRCPRHGTRAHYIAATLVTGHEAVQTWVVQSQRRHCMLNNSKNIVVSGGSFTVVHGNYPTNSDARIQGKIYLVLFGH